MDICTGCCDITEIMLKMKLNTIQSINHSIEKQTHLDLILYFNFHCVCLCLFSHFIKGGYLDFSHLTELKNIYITEIYMKKQYKSPRIKNHKITFFMVFP